MIARDVKLPNGSSWMLTPWEIVITDADDMSPTEIGNFVLYLLDQRALLQQENDEAMAGSVRGRGAPEYRTNRTFSDLVRRDGRLCRVPGCASQDLEIDHIVARAKGGSNRLENLQLLCSRHNNAKGVMGWHEFLEEELQQLLQARRDLRQTFDAWRACGFQLEDTE